jgi:capsular polysaccharide biosynthesis protein
MSGTTRDTTGPVQGSRFTWSGLARRLPVIVVLLAVGTTLGFLGARQQPATYTATATVLVEPANGNPYAPGARGQNLANLGTEAQLVSSDAVAQLAKTTLRSKASVAALVEQLAVTNPPNSQVLEVAYTDITPAAARDGANAFASAYLVARERRAAESVQAQINNLTKARNANQSALQRNLAALNKTTAGTPARVLADQRVAATTAEATKLENQISDLRLFQGDPGQVLSPANLPGGAAGLPGWIMPFAGAGVGLLLGLVLAIMQALKDRTLRTVDDVKALGYPVLSTVHPAADEHADALLVDASTGLPDGARLLRSVLGVASPDGGAVLLVPAGAAESHTITPLALAAALARADQTVALVDAGGELTRATQLGDAVGVADVLNDSAESSEVVHEYQPNLRFVPVGPKFSASVDKLASPQMREFIDGLSPESRWVLVAGPVASAPETLTLADLCTDVVLLVSLRQTTSVDLQHAAEAVTRGGARLVGVVVDQTSRGRSRRTRKEETPVVVAPATESAPAASAQAASAQAASAQAASAQAASAQAASAQAASAQAASAQPASAQAVAAEPASAHSAPAPKLVAVDERTEEMSMLEDRPAPDDETVGAEGNDRAGQGSSHGNGSTNGQVHGSAGASANGHVHGSANGRAKESSPWFPDAADDDEETGYAASRRSV